MFIGESYESFRASNGANYDLYAAYSVGYCNNFDSYSVSANSGFILPSKPSILCMTLAGYYVGGSYWIQGTTDCLVESISPNSLTGHGEFVSFTTGDLSISVQQNIFNLNEAEKE